MCSVITGLVLRKNLISTEITYHCRTVDQVRRHQPIDTHDADHRVSISQVSVFPWIWFPSRRLSAISAQLDREYLVLRIDEGGRYCTTETLKTHKTDLGEVVYPWHPFLWKAVKIKGKRNRRGTIVYVCSSDGNDGGAVVEVPAWMFDSAVCCLLHPGSHPRNVRKIKRGHAALI